MTNTDTLTIAGQSFTSRLFLGTGKYASPKQTVAALDASGTQLVTVAIRRLDLDNPNARTELDYIDWSRYTVLPNTAGCKTVDEALLTARLGRSVTGSNWVKLEVIPNDMFFTEYSAGFPVESVYMRNTVKSPVCLGHIQLSVSPPNFPIDEGGAPTRRTSR